MAYIRGFGRYLPERVVDNQEVAALTGADPSWILEMSGIATRRFAAEGETVASMAAAAARHALGDLAPLELDLILVSSGASDRRFPGPASEVQHLLGASKAVAWDIPLASAGSLFGMAQAEMCSGRYRKILVAASEKMSVPAFVDGYEKGTAMLFGDGAGACLIDADRGAARIVDFELGTNGEAASELRLDFDSSIRMNGRMVIMHASRKLPSVIQTLLSRNGNQQPAIYLMHQANSNLIEKVAKTLNVPVSDFYSNIARYGNTSSASMLIAASEWAEETGGFKPGQSAVFAAFGAGFQWGALLAEGV
jgi:3-oxoacyl-[acyl-carrier-protein] synthase III